MGIDFHFTIPFLLGNFGVQFYQTIIFLLGGLALISYDSGGKRLTLSRGMAYAFAACVLWGLLYALIKPINLLLGAVLTSFFIEAGVFIGAGVHLTAGARVISIPSRRNLLRLTLVALGASLGFLCYNAGVAVMNRTSLVAAITFASPALAALGGKLFFRESLAPRQWLALAVIFISLVGLKFA